VSTSKRIAISQNEKVTLFEQYKHSIFSETPTVQETASWIPYVGLTAEENMALDCFIPKKWSKNAVNLERLSHNCKQLTINPSIFNHYTHSLNVLKIKKKSDNLKIFWLLTFTCSTWILNQLIHAKCIGLISSYLSFWNLSDWTISGFFVDRKFQRWMVSSAVADIIEPSFAKKMRCKTAQHSDSCFACISTPGRPNLKKKYPC